MADVRINALSTESLVPAADAYLALDGTTDGSRKMKPANLGLPHYAARPGIVSAGTSAVGTTQDNTGLAAGTSDRSGEMFVRLPDYTPAANVPLMTKFASNLGTKLWLVTTGVLRLEYGNGSNFTTYRFDSTVAIGSTDGAWVHIAWTEDRDGNLTWYVNGAQLGSPVSIAAASAQTVTNTGALLWGSDGTTHATGTFGECAKVSGLFTATQIASIYRAGSIAPFCTFTANATTGQNTATIGGLSFFQWLDFGQGYASGGVIFDRSGSNQVAILGTSGLTHAVRRNPPGTPMRAPRAGLIGDGTNGSGARNTLNTQNTGTGDVTLWFDFGNIASSSQLASAYVGSSTTTAAAANTLRVNCDRFSGVLDIFLYGATASDFRKLRVSAFATHLDVGRAVVAFVRTSTGVRVFAGIRGDLTDITNLAVESTGGTPPAWTDTIDADYANLFQYAASTSGAFTLYDFRLANVAMTEAQLRTEYERGEPGPEWVGATKTPTYTSNFATADSWSATGVTQTANYDSGDVGHTVTLRLVADDGSSDRSDRNVTVVKGRTCRVVIGYKPVVGSSHRLQVLSGSDTLYNNLSVGAVGSWYSVTTDVVPTGTTLTIRVYAANAGSAADEILVDGVSVTPIGITTRLRTDEGGGFQAMNDAASATNDASHFEISTTGVTWATKAPIGARVAIRGTKLHSDISTSSSTTVFGVRPAGWKVVDFQSNVDVAFDAGRTLDLGSAGTPALIVSGLAVDTTGFKRAASLSDVPSSLTANQTLYGRKSGSTSSGNLLQYTIVLERVY